jgi:hypothetical protein
LASGISIEAEGCASSAEMRIDMSTFVHQPRYLG